MLSIEVAFELWAVNPVEWSDLREQFYRNLEYKDVESGAGNKAAYLVEFQRKVCVI